MSENVTIDDISGPEGQWLVVVKGRVIASSSELLDMLKLAEKYPEADTLVTMVLYPRASFF